MLLTFCPARVCGLRWGSAGRQDARGWAMMARASTAWATGAAAGTDKGKQACACGGRGGRRASVRGLADHPRVASLPPAGGRPWGFGKGWGKGDIAGAGASPDDVRMMGIAAMQTDHTCSRDVQPQAPCTYTAVRDTAGSARVEGKPRIL